MPRIKAYKGAGKVIPVDEAKISTAFRCPWTRKVYSNKRDYVKHLAMLRRTRMHGRIREKVRQRKCQDLWNQNSFSDVIDWLERNPEFIFDNGLKFNWRYQLDDLEAIRKDFWFKITYLDVRWGNTISNSHHCPRNGVTNWNRDPVDRKGNPIPSGYPGFEGRIEYQLSHDVNFGSDAVRDLGIHTGSGGGISNQRFGYSVQFFDADWPGLVAARTMEILADSNWKEFRYGTPVYFR